MSRLFKAALMSLCLFAPSLLATEYIHFVNLDVQPKEDGLHIKLTPERLLPFDILKDDKYNLSRGDYENSLDAPFRQTAFLMRTLERNRGTIYADKSKPLPIISFEFEMAIRDITGEVLHNKEYKVIVGLHPEDGKGAIFTEDGLNQQTFDILNLTSNEPYRDFIRKLMLPQEEAVFPNIAAKQYIVDLYYQWPRNEVSESDFNVFDLFPSTILWDNPIIRKIIIQLGATYRYQQEDGSWAQVQSAHMRRFKEALTNFDGIVAKLDDDDPETLIPLLEEYLGQMPDDEKAMKLLMESYLKAGYDDEAYSLIARFQPFFATIRGGLKNLDDLSETAERRRMRLLGKKSSFSRNREVKVNITAPEPMDIVTGTTDMTFVVEGNDSPILEIECYLDEQLIGKLTQPPFRIPFTVEGAKGRLELRVTAYFEDETFQEDTIRVTAISVDQEELVNLVPMRVSVFQTLGAGRDLTIDDFKIEENDQDMKVNSFRRGTAPLRIAILMDTSISMFGDKFYRAQYAVRTFLSKLQPEDRVAVYAFDGKVLNLTDFTDDFDSLVPPLMTMTPLGATSLYDGMMVAHDALMGQNGTKVMIVMSDGDDSASQTTDIHIASELRRSPVMVYSVILPGGPLGDPDRGALFLQEIARMTGSTSTRVRSTKKLSETFSKIYDELRSFYYIDYYSQVANPNAREIKVKVKGLGNRIRFRTL
jgi:VWFA-related protein